MIEDQALLQDPGLELLQYLSIGCPEMAAVTYIFSHPDAPGRAWILFDDPTQGFVAQVISEQNSVTVSDQSTTKDFADNCGDPAWSAFQYIITTKLNITHENWHRAKVDHLRWSESTWPLASIFAQRSVAGEIPTLSNQDEVLHAIEMLLHPKVAFREMAAKALCNTDTKNALWKMAEAGDIRVIDGLVEVLLHGSQSKSKRASQLLRQMGAAAIRPLIDARSRAWDEEIVSGMDVEANEMGVAHAEAALKAITGPEAIRSFIQMLQDAGAPLGVRMVAAERLGELRAQEAVEPLTAALDSPEENLQYEAIHALGRLHDRRTVEPLIALLSRSEGRVKAAVVQALGWLRDPAAVQPLIAALEDQSWDVRFCAVRALESLNTSESRQALEQYRDM